MTKEEMIDIAKECGLTTYGEAFDNIQLHFSMFFRYKDAEKELNKLWDQIKHIPMEDDL